MHAFKLYSRKTSQAYACFTLMSFSSICNLLGYWYICALTICFSLLKLCTYIFCSFFLLWGVSFYWFVKALCGLRVVALCLPFRLQNIFYKFTICRLVLCLVTVVAYTQLFSVVKSFSMFIMIFFKCFA